MKVVCTSVIKFKPSNSRSLKFKPSNSTTLWFLSPVLTPWGRGTIEFAIVFQSSVRPSVHPINLNTNAIRPAHTTSVCVQFAMYHAPNVAHVAKNTIILSRRGTPELCVHWLELGFLAMLYQYQIISWDLHFRLWILFLCFTPQHRIIFSIDHIIF